MTKTAWMDTQEKTSQYLNFLLALHALKKLFIRFLQFIYRLCKAIQQEKLFWHNQI